MKILIFKKNKKKKIINKNNILILIKNIIKQFKQKVFIIIKIVNKKKILKFNLIYRGKNKYTNILSFKNSKFYNFKEYIGDLIIYNKKNICNLNFIHNIIHSILHLFNFKHYSMYEKKQMEILEIEVLNNFGYNNPYYLTN
ncbi:MAG: rRNA maturation RNase YbeY [Enterobacteriaceae bacterium PC38]|nr:MAG: rRNA maturation RNase YbeY [Enterobacteriaceae bacterium PC38]